MTNERTTLYRRDELPEEERDEGSQLVDVAAGGVLHIPSNLPHRAEALDLDVFAAPRGDWLDGTDAYLREPA